MRMRRKHNLDKRMENCAHLLVGNPESLRGKWLQSFSFSELHLEIGCGKGRFIIEAAKQNPSVLFVAIEKYSNVLITALEKAVREEITNIRFLNTVAENLSEIFALREVSRIYINFCDPWPLKRHRKRRLVDGSFLCAYKDFLTPAGEIRFKTDNRELFEFALEEFAASGFSADLDTENENSIITEYEQKFLDAGMPIYKCRAHKAKL